MRTLTLCCVLLFSTACESTPKVKKWVEEPEIPLVIHLAGAPDSISHATVSDVQPPDVGYGALVYPDPNHVKAVLAPMTGIIQRMEPAGHLDSTTVAGIIRAHSGETRPIRLPGEGVWRPRRESGQTVLAGDTIGLIIEHGFWLAVGQVSDIEYGVIRNGDIALVTLERERTPRTGHVESIRPPGSRNPYTAEVAVEFSADEDFFSAGANFAHVEVTPLGTSRRMLAVPRSSIVRLGLGHAVFLPKDDRTFDVRWILTGSDVGELTVVRRGLERGLRVVTAGLEPIALAARDSLVKRSDAMTAKR